MIMEVAKLSTEAESTEVASTGASSRTRLIIVRSLIVFFVVAMLTLFVMFVYGSLETNRIVAGMKDFEPGTELSAVVAKYGEPDRIDAVDGNWTWGRRFIQTPDAVKAIAAYNRNISPQVCTYHLDADNRIVKIEVFASY
jgi:hypothetical protein